MAQLEVKVRIMDREAIRRLIRCIKRRKWQQAGKRG